MKHDMVWRSSDFCAEQIYAIWPFCSWLRGITKDPEKTGRTQNTSRTQGEILTKGRLTRTN
jgi:hypothetical protein